MFKKILYFLSLLTVLCFLSAPLSAQTITTVSGQIFDPNGIRFAGGSLNITIVTPSGGASPTVTATGSPVASNVPVTLDQTGFFSQNLVANASITPASTTYSFRFCAPSLQAPLAGTTQSCFNLTGVTVSGSTQDISTTAYNVPSPRLAQRWNPSREAFTLPASGTASIGATTLITADAHPLTGKLFTFKPYISQTVLGASCAGNTTIVVSVIYTDPNAASPQTQAIGTWTVTTNGTLGIVPLTSNSYAGQFNFVAAPSTVIQYSTTYTAGGSCSPAPAVQVYPLLEMN